MDKRLIFLCLICSSAGAIDFAPIYDQDLSNPAIKITRDEQGNWLEIITNQWHDVVYTDDGKKSYIYQQAYNYQKQTGFLRTFTPDMQPVSETQNPMGGGMISREELLVAFKIFKSNPVVIKLLEQEKEPIKVFGGFGYVDKNKQEPCYQGQRCVHVFAHTESKTMVAHAIVKLNDQSVPYPDYDGLMKQKEEKE
jgi:hypothetical protein